MVRLQIGVEGHHLTISMKEWRMLGIKLQKEKSSQDTGNTNCCSVVLATRPEIIALECLRFECYRNKAKEPEKSSATKKPVKSWHNNGVGKCVPSKWNSSTSTCCPLNTTILPYVV